METDAFLRQLTADGTRLAGVAGAADWDSPVPGTDLTLREVLVHTGAVHRWSADIVRRALTSNEHGGSTAFHPGLPDDEVLAWFDDGLTALTATLAGVPDDLEAWAFGRQRPAARFWSRRQAHETAIHRTDVESAAGVAVAAFDAEFAQDGLAELVGGFAGQRGFATSTPGRLALRATDGDDWLVVFGGERIVGAPSGEIGVVDATVTGSSSDLYRWVWNRPSPAVVEGDDAVVALWREVRIG